MSTVTLSILVGALASIASIPRASAHGFVQGIVANGQWYGGYQPGNFPYQHPPPTVIGWTVDDVDLGFVNVTKYADPDIICHHSATPGGTHAEVAAGSTVELQWSIWPSAHHGPVLDYLANCNGDCEKVDKTTLEFFKIDEGGLLDGSVIPGNWASDTLVANNNSWTVTIPSSIAPGNYVLRHEIIALHQADQVDGAQAYPQCVNLKITGSGTLSPPGIPATEFYHEKDPGIFFSIWLPMTEGYQIPGPPMFDGSSSSGNSSAVVSESSSSAMSYSSSSSPTSSAASSYDAPSTSVYYSTDPTTTADDVASSYSPSAAPTSSSPPKSECPAASIAMASSSAAYTPSSSSIYQAAVVDPTSTGGGDDYAAPTTSATTPPTSYTTPAPTPATSAAAALDSVLASMTSSVPSAIMTSAAPTVTASYANGTKTFSTDGMSVADLFALLKQVSAALKKALGFSGHWKAPGGRGPAVKARARAEVARRDAASHPGRRHARDLDFVD